MDIKRIVKEAKKRFKNTEHLPSLDGPMLYDRNFLLEDLSEMGQPQVFKENSKKIIQKFTSQNFSFIFKIAMEERKLYFLGMGLIIFTPFLHILSAFTLKPLVEHGLTPKDLNKVLFWGLIYIVLELFAFLFVWQGRKVMARASSYTLLSMRKKLFNHLEGLPLSYLDRQPQGRIITRVTYDVENLDSFFTEHLVRFFSSFVTIFIATSAMILTQPLLGSLMIISIGPAIYFLWKSRTLVDRSNRSVSIGNSSVNSKLAEFISAISVIRSFGLEKWSIREFERTVESYMKAHLSANKVYSFIRPMASFFCSFPLLILIGFGGYLIEQGHFSLALFLVFVRYYDIFYGPVIFLAHEVNVLQEALTSSERLRVFLLAPNESFDLGVDGSYVTEKLKGDIIFSEVSMAYKQKFEVVNQVSADDRKIYRYALKGISFAIASGERIGLVGRTGCGKSTTVSLLSRLYSYQEGQILIDGRKIEDYQRSSLRNNIGLVSQEVIIFKGTLRDNLFNSNEVELSPSQIEQMILSACEKTGLFEVMKKKDMKLSDLIFEGGTNLSQGEKQLIGLTRILIRNPSILILDEATANIDPHYEMIIHKAIRQLMEGRTCLLIAHRLQTLKDCHRLLVFQDGKIVESGSETSLIEKRGYFYDLYINAKNNSNNSIDILP